LVGTKRFLRTSGGLVPIDEGLALFPIMEHGMDAMARRSTASRAGTG
jgi:LysR family transcriptional regulator of beta-lactamase